MSIIVQRQPADKPGDLIISGILTTTEAQLERGTHDINHSSKDRIIVDGVVPELSFVQPGTTVRIDNKGIIKNGLITRFSGRISTTKIVEIRSQITTETIK